LVLRRKAERRALKVLRGLDEAKELGGQVDSLLGATTMLSAGAEAGMCERFWLRRVVQDHLPQSKTSGVLRGHAQVWDKWWPWLAARLRARGREATIEQLCECPEMVAALLAKVFAQSKGRTAVHRVAQSVNFVLNLRGFAKLANLPLAKAVKRSADRQRKGPRKKASVMRRHEVAQIVTLWGARGQPLWKRWIALFVGLAVCTLARWADMRFPLCGLILPAEGAASVCMPRRKNRQTGETFWAAVPPSATCELLRDLVASKGFAINACGEVQAPEGAFLFPILKHVPSSGRSKRATWQVEHVNAPLSKNQYGVYLRRYRAALRACCSFSSTEAALFSLHSGRRTGDTLLRRSGVSQDLRMAAGCWLDRDSEALYNDMSDTEREALFAHTAV
jgi:hypothetical protein